MIGITPRQGRCLTDGTHHVTDLVMLQLYIIEVYVILPYRTRQMGTVGSTFELVLQSFSWDSGHYLKKNQLYLLDLPHYS
jgi:hypothetical protein